MTFITKLAISFITIFTAVVGGIWTGYEKMDDRMDKKVDAGKTEVLKIVHTLRDERNSLLKAQDDKTTVQLVYINNEMSEIRKDIRSILIIARKKQAFIESPNKEHYTRMETTNGDNSHGI